MKSIRLLPVVIFAALALLVFKGIGLVTNGSYVLGPAIVQAAGGGGGHGGGEAAAPADSGSALPGEVVLTDTSPTMDDTSPTLAAKPEAGGEHGSTGEAHDGSSDESHGDASSDESHGESSEDPESATPACPPVEGEAGAEGAVECAPVAGAPVNENGDALPTMRDSSGNIVPLTTADSDSSQDALIGRLGERRAELDKRQADLDMRAVLLEAAEKRLDERTQQLAALEAQVAALVDEKQAVEEAGFKAVVSMYEGMKPKDAAKIFDTLELQVLLKVARAMSPRKMSPILAAMSAKSAEALTVAMASVESTDVAAVKMGENLAALPQIVGQ